MLERFQVLMGPGALLVDRYPTLKYVPGYTSYLEEWRKEESQLFHDQLNCVSKEMVGFCKVFSIHDLILVLPRPPVMQVPHSLAISSRTNRHKLSDEDMAYLAGSLFGAGADTTAVTIIVLVMAAACYPRAQEKVQEELDVVVGRDRGVSSVGVCMSERKS
jgi:hypothetical protein